MTWSTRLSHRLGKVGCFRAKEWVLCPECRRLHRPLDFVVKLLWCSCGHRFLLERSKR